MTIAEELIQKGWQKGQQEGWRKGQQEGILRGRLVGRIQICQDLLHLAASPAEELALQRTEDLQTMLDGLESQVRGRLN